MKHTRERSGRETVLRRLCLVAVVAPLTVIATSGLLRPEPAGSQHPERAFRGRRRSRDPRRAGPARRRRGARLGVQRAAPRLRRARRAHPPASGRRRGGAGPGADRLPARRDRDAAGRPRLSRDLAADRRHRPGGEQPRPLRRCPDDGRRGRAPRDPRSAAHRAGLVLAHRRHRRRPARRRPARRPRGRPDAVHPVDLDGRGRGRRRRRPSRPAGHRRRQPGHRRLPVQRHGRPGDQRPDSAPPSTATTTARPTSTS